MNLNIQNNLHFFTFSALDRFSGLRHGVFTRWGGCGKPPFDGLNIGINGEDDPETVIKNREAVARCLGSPAMIFLRQVHGSGVVVIDGDAVLDQPKEADAAITGLPGVFLAIQVADCQSVLMYDPVKQVVAAVHSGWRGSLQNIIGKTIGIMKSHFGCQPSDIIAGIGPSLGPCCAEFIHYKKEIPESFWIYKDNRDHFDFWAASRDQLIQAGLQTDNMGLPNLCTRCNDHLFFSYRKARQTGRFVAVIGIAHV